MALFYRYLLEYSINIVCVLMCYIPMKDRLALPVKRLVVTDLCVLAVFTAAAAALSAYRGIYPKLVVFVLLPLFLLLYFKTVNAGKSECLFVFMYVSSLERFSCLYAIIYDALHDSQGYYAALSVKSLVFKWAVFLGFFAIFFLQREKLRWLTENFRTRSMKKYLWLIPFFYTLITISIIPVNYGNLLYRGRSIVLYTLIVTVLFISELAIIHLFCHIAREMLNSEELLRCNQLLEVQAHQYEILRDYMEHTKRLRHDFRQQVLTVSSLAESKDYEELSRYLAQYRENSFVSGAAELCRNNAVNAIAGYYLRLAQSKEIETDWGFDLPERLPLPESIFCGLLGNLIENAIDGCETVKEGTRIIHISAEQRGRSMIVLVIENTFNGVIKRGKDGLPRSTKHKRNGIGIESAKAAAEKYNGHIRIDISGNIFCVNILLNP